MHGIYILLIMTLICFAGIFSFTLRSDEELTYRSVLRDLGKGIIMATALYGYGLFSDLLFKELIIAAGCSALCWSYFVKFVKLPACLRK